MISSLAKESTLQEHYKILILLFDSNDTKISHNQFCHTMQLLKKTA